MWFKLPEKIPGNGLEPDEAFIWFVMFFFGFWIWQICFWWWPIVR